MSAWTDPEGHEIDAASFHAARAAGEPLRLIDCREADEFALCQIEGAQLVPLSQFAETAPAALAGEEHPIIIYCHHGMRSLRAVQWLRARGHARTWSLAGGIDHWSESIDPAVPRY